MMTEARQIVVDVCDQCKDSDLRADNPRILLEFDKRLAELRTESTSLRLRLAAMTEVVHQTAARTADILNQNHDNRKQINRLKATIAGLETREHFNGLSPEQHERLTLLAEESAEVIAAICKIFRHGLDSFHPDDPTEETNQQALAREMGDQAFAAQLCTDNHDVPLYAVDRQKTIKSLKVMKYMHHQEKS